MNIYKAFIYKDEEFTHHNEELVSDIDKVFFEGIIKYINIQNNMTIELLKSDMYEDVKKSFMNKRIMNC